MNTLYDLTKRIDTLTYNSQQVLNALIRSCVASGSSSGYRVKKYGQEIELTREDIYCLYSFYEEWKAAGFPGDSTTFYKLLGEADRRFSATGTPVTDAVAKHGRILYMASTNTGDPDSAWVERIRESASPAATVSTAPIPINLRSPLYDENLSTKSFSQYETYLFPMGYHRNELLGTPGNGEDYVAGGRNWMFDVSDTLMLTGRHIVAGAVSNPANRVANYRDSNTTLSWGTESYAHADDSLAAGRRSVANADVSMASGERSVAYGRWSNALGGKEVRTLGDGSLATNWGTTAGGARSTAGNYGAVTGGWPYAFTFETVATDAQVSTDCEAIVTPEGTCMASSTADMLRDAASKDVLVVSAAEAGKARLKNFDIRVGDMVYVYDLSYVKDGNPVECTDENGYTNRLFSAKVTAIANNPGGGYRVTLDRPVPSEYSGVGSLASGKVAAYMRGGVSLGEDSAALNHFTIAAGERQAVVGSSNVPSLDANFVVGVGSSYIEPDGKRANGLLVGSEYGYMKLADGSAMVGVSGDDGRSGDDENVSLFRGAFVQAGTTATGDGMTRLNVRPTNALMTSYISQSGSELTYARFGVANTYGTLSSVGEVSALLHGVRGVAVLASGSYIAADSTELNLVDYMLSKSDSIIRAHDNAVGIYSASDIEIRNLNRGISINASSYLTQSFTRLFLNGETFGAFTATDKAQSFQIDNSGTEGREKIPFTYMTGQSGFFHSTYNGNDDVTQSIVPNVSEWDNGTSVHSFNSTVADGNTFETVSIAVPAHKVANAPLKHPLLVVGRYAEGDTTVDDVETKHLAFLDDMPRCSSGVVSRAGFAYNPLDGQCGPNYVLAPNDSTIVCMPALKAISGQWKIGLWSVPQGSGIQVNRINLIEGSPNGDSVLCTLYGIKYSLNGQQMSLQFNCVMGNDIGNNVTGVGVNIGLGCAVDTVNTMGGIANSTVGGAVSQNTLSYTSFIGSIQRITSSTPYSVDSNIAIGGTANVLGVALNDGTVMVYMTAPGSTFESNGRYRVTLTGTIPCMPAIECCGNANTSAWQYAMRTAVGRLDHFNLYDWVSGLADNPNVLGTGLLHRFLYDQVES